MPGSLDGRQRPPPHLRVLFLIFRSERKCIFYIFFSLSKLRKFSTDKYYIPYLVTWDRQLEPSHKTFGGNFKLVGATQEAERRKPSPPARRRCRARGRHWPRRRARARACARRLARRRRRTGRRRRRRREAHAVGRRQPLADDLAARRARAICWATKALALVERGDAARWRKTATPEVEYWIRFSMTWPSAGGASIQPIRQPVIAQFFEKVWTKRMRSSGSIRCRGRRRRALALIDEAAVDLVGDDPEPCLRASVEHDRRSSGVAVQPVGLDGELMTMARVRGVIAASSRSRSSVQPRRRRIHAAPRRAGAARTPIAATKFGQAGVGTMTSSPAPATMRMPIWTRLHAATGRRRSARASKGGRRARVIARERLAQLRDAALPGVEGLARREATRPPPRR